MDIGKLVELLEKNGYRLKVFYDRVDVVSIDNQLFSWRTQGYNLVSIVSLSLFEDNCNVTVNYFDQKNQVHDKKIKSFPVDNLEILMPKITAFIYGSD